MINYVLPADSAFTMHEYFAHEPPELVNRFRIVHFEDLPATTEFAPGPYVIAGIEQATPAMTELITELADALTNAGCKVLNHPQRTLGRLQLLQEFHRNGRNSFRAVRARDDFENLNYPVFLRNERDHNGNISSLLNSPEEVRTAIGYALLRGNALDELVLIEFCSTADASGVIRKYSAYNIDGRILARSLNAGRQWMLKLGSSDFTHALVQEEFDYVHNNPHAEELLQIFAGANIEYGQIDYSLKNGRIETWEINLNPTIGRALGPGKRIVPEEFEPVRGQTREYFFDRFREAWSALDEQSPHSLPATITLNSELRRRAAEPRRVQGGTVRRLLSTLFRPVKPIIGPVAAKIMARAAVRRNT